MDHYTKLLLLVAKNQVAGLRAKGLTEEALEVEFEMDAVRKIEEKNAAIRKQAGVDYARATKGGKK